MLVRVQVEASASCGFTGCITLKTTAGLTVAELLVSVGEKGCGEREENRKGEMFSQSEVLKSVARKMGKSNLDESHFHLTIDGQEITSVQA